MEQRCQNPHPRKPGDCNYLLKAKGIGIITVECPRCRGPIEFNFVLEGTEAFDKIPVLA